MENLSEAKKEFNQKLSKLQKDAEPSLYENNLSDIVIYEKLLEIQKQVSNVKDKSGSKEL